MSVADARCRRAGSSAARRSSTTGRTGRDGRSESGSARRCRTGCRADAAPAPSPSPSRAARRALRRGRPSVGPAPMTSCSATMSASMRADHVGDPGRIGAAVEAAAAVDVVGRDAQRAPVGVGHRALEYSAMAKLKSELELHLPVLRGNCSSWMSISVASSRTSEPERGDKPELNDAQSILAAEAARREALLRAVGQKRRRRAAMRCRAASRRR